MKEILIGFFCGMIGAVIFHFLPTREPKPIQLDTRTIERINLKKCLEDKKKELYINERQALWVCQEKVIESVMEAYRGRGEIK